jgi:hypothetical protein
MSDETSFGKGVGNETIDSTGSSEGRVEAAYFSVVVSDEYTHSGHDLFARAAGDGLFTKPH